MKHTAKLTSEYVERHATLPSYYDHSQSRPLFVPNLSAERALPPYLLSPVCEYTSIRERHIAIHPRVTALLARFAVVLPFPSHSREGRLLMFDPCRLFSVRVENHTFQTRVVCVAHTIHVANKFPSALRQ
jgi:hypothetical protein